MVNKIRRWTRFAIFAVIGCCIGYSAWQCWDYAVRPGLYAMRAAPWYTGILVTCGAAAVLEVLLLVLRLALRKYEKSRKLPKDSEESRKNY